MIGHQRGSRIAHSGRRRYLPWFELLDRRESPTVLLQFDAATSDVALLPTREPAQVPTSAGLPSCEEWHAAHSAVISTPPNREGPRGTMFTVLGPVETLTTGVPSSSFASRILEDAFATDEPADLAARHLPFLPSGSPAVANGTLVSETDLLPGSGSSSTFFAPPRSPGDHQGSELFQAANAIRPPGDSRDEPGPGGPDPTYAGFTESIYVQDRVNLAQITGMGWATDGTNRLFLMRKTGEVMIIQDGQLLPTPFATIRPIFTEFECGLIGMAFDPNYTANRYIYFFATVSDSEQQIIRFTDDNNLGTDQTTILAGLPTGGGSHNGGAVGFGVDGKLTFAIGDLGDSTGVNEDLTSLAAKIGRANPDGTVPDDNPFHDGDGPNNDTIWARGFRNPYTFTVQPTTGLLWVNVVGNAYEQVMVVNAADHAGWDLYENDQPEGFLAPVIKYATNGADTATLVTAGATRSDGIATFTTSAPHGFRRGESITVSGVADSSFDGTQFVLDVPSPTTFRLIQPGPDATSGGGEAVTGYYGGAVLGGTFYSGTQFPSDFWDNYFFGDFNTGSLFRAALDGLNNVTSWDTFSTGLGLYIDSETGPDGALYYVNFEGTVYRLTHATSGQGIILSHTHINTVEGNQNAFSVSLREPPVSPIEINVVNSVGDTDIQILAGATLTFTADNWSTPQRVVLAAGEDADSVSDSAMLEVSSPGVASQFVNVFAWDNDPDINAPPKAVISNPQEGDEVSGAKADFFGNGYDDGGTAYAEFYVDDILEWVDPDNPNDPSHYHYGGGHNSWDTTIYKNGPHRLKLVVYDVGGLAGESTEVTVTINN